MIQEYIIHDIGINVRLMNNHKDGPIHFYPTYDRDSFIANVVEYCVHIGERQPLLKSQASWLVASSQVIVDGLAFTDLSKKVNPGARQICIRGKNHHVMVHQPVFE